jgi:2,2-dialkylglycine decarboxylase (pyruvate)
MRLAATSFSNAHVASVVTSEELEECRQYMLPVLNFRKPVLVRGEKSRVWDSQGNSYLDLNSGQFCAAFGHSDPEVAALMTRICTTLQDTDTSTLSVQVLAAARAMRGISQEMRARVLFLSTGAEAVECCLRYAKHIKEKPGIISFDRGYHGQTHGSAAYSMSRDRIRPPLSHSYSTPTPEWFSPEPAPDDVIAPCVEAFRRTITQNRQHIAAAIFEPIVSGGGAYFPPVNYFNEIQEICRAHDIFLVFDESQTGMGRTGHWFYHQRLGVIPDFVIAAKAMGLGFPVSCVLANESTVPHEKFIMEHFSSHQNEPFSGEIVSYLIDYIKNNDILALNRKHGAALLNIINQLSNDHPLIERPRGVGLFCAFDLKFSGDSKISGAEFCRRALDYGLLLQHCNLGKTIRLLPNYKITLDDLREFGERLDVLLRSYNHSV